VYQWVAIRCRAILYFFICSYEELFVCLFKNICQFFWNSKRSNLLQSKMLLTSLLHAFYFFLATFNRCLNMVHSAVIAKRVLTLRYRKKILRVLVILIADITQLSIRFLLSTCHFTLSLFHTWGLSQ
jgi:hypothetical protein